MTSLLLRTPCAPRSVFLRPRSGGVPRPQGAYFAQNAAEYATAAGAPTCRAAPRHATRTLAHVRARRQPRAVRLVRAPRAYRPRACRRAPDAPPRLALPGISKEDATAKFGGIFATVYLSFEVRPASSTRILGKTMRGEVRNKERWNKAPCAYPRS